MWSAASLADALTHPHHRCFRLVLAVHLDIRRGTFSVAAVRAFLTGDVDSVAADAAALASVALATAEEAGSVSSSSRLRLLAPAAASALLAAVPAASVTVPLALGVDFLRAPSL